MQTYTIIIPITRSEGEAVYKTDSGHVELRERTVQAGESLPSAPAYELSAGTAADVAAARGWEEVTE